MSQQRESLPNNDPVFRQPVNLDIIRDVVLPSEHELLSPRVDVRSGRYVVAVEDSGQPGMLPEDKDFTIHFFSNWDTLVTLADKGREYKPLKLSTFIRQVRLECGASTAQQLTLWATSDLAAPAARISSDYDFAIVVTGYADIFLREPLNHAILYFFVEFDRRSGTIPSRRSREYIAQPFLLGRTASEVGLGGGSSRNVSNDPVRHVPYPKDATAPAETVPPNEAPEEPLAQPKRSHTFESSRKAVSKLTIAVKNAAGTVRDLTSPREAPEQRTVLTELGSGTEERDYLTSLLPSASGSPERQQRLFERWAQFFPHIDTKQRENTRSIRFRHTALAITPHQFVRAMQILFQDHTTGGIAGGLLASEMGSGKSIIVLASVVIRATLFQSKRIVEKEWEEAEMRAGSSSKQASSSQNVPKLEHLPRNAPKGRGLSCPTEAHRGNGCICFCVPDGATRVHISKLKPGAALILVPSAAMPGWIEILEGAIFSRISFNVTVLYSGPPLNSRLQPGPDFLGGTRFNRWKMGAILPDGHPGGLIKNTEELQWFAQPAPLSDTSKTRGASMAMETYITVQPHSSTRLRELYSWSISDLSPAPAGCQFPPEGLYAFPVGIIFIDEAAKVLEERSLPLQMAREHHRIQATPSATRPPDLWLVTGTPFAAQLNDLAAAVSLISPQRAGDARRLHITYEAMRSAMTDTPRATFEALFDSVFGGKLVIRDDHDTIFLGSRVSDTRKVRPQFISRNTPESQLHSVRMIIDTMVSRGPRDAYFDTLVKLKQNTQLLYLLSMFPSAAQLLLEMPNLPFTDLDTRRTIRKEGNTTGESLQSHKDFRSFAEKLNRGPRSPKLQYILNVLERMSTDVTPRPQISKAAASANVQSDLTLKKLVIITPTLFTALVVYVVLARFHPRSGPLFYHEDLKQSQRQDVLRRFNSLRKRDGPTRVFIAPASVASEALNLQIANRLILTSPLLDLHQQNQALARVNRSGQCFDVDLTVLLLEDSPIDRIVVAHRAGVKLENDPFNVDESVSVVYNE